LRRRVWSRNLVFEEVMAHWGLSRQKQTNEMGGVRSNNENNKKCIQNFSR